MTHSMTVHMRIKHGNPAEMVPCPYQGCNRSVRKDGVKKHFREIHEPGVCPHKDCGAQFKTKHSMTYHISKVHKELQKWTCPHCPHVAKSKQSLQRHVDELHATGRKYPCPEFGCHQTFKRLRNLRQHSFLHLSIKPFRCKWCDFSGVQQNNIRSHALSSHHEEFLLAQKSGEKYWHRHDSLPPPLSTDPPTDPLTDLQPKL